MFCAGPAVIQVVGNDVYSEGDGTVSCCVTITGLPTGGLGCDIQVELDVMSGAGTNGAGMEVCVLSNTPQCFS